MGRSSVHPGTLVDVAVQLHRDESAGVEALAQRDRAVGLELGLGEADASATTPDARAGLLVRWLHGWPMRRAGAGRRIGQPVQPAHQQAGSGVRRRRRRVGLPQPQLQPDGPVPLSQRLHPSRLVAVQLHRHVHQRPRMNG